MKILEMETGLITKEVMLEQAAWEDKNELKWLKIWRKANPYCESSCTGNGCKPA